MHLRIGDTDREAAPRPADYDVKSDLRGKKVATRVRPKNSVCCTHGEARALRLDNPGAYDTGRKLAALRIKRFSSPFNLFLRELTSFRQILTSIGSLGPLNQKAKHELFLCFCMPVY